MQDRKRWQWFAGRDARDAPTWTRDASKRVPVLEEPRRLYQATTQDFGAYVSDLSLLSQGSVVYVAPLQRYLYTSWTEYTFEFYEAPTPWGPFQRFFSLDFGVYPWSGGSAGGYATTIPSKFISSDGRSMFVQSNTFIGGSTHYGFSLREFVVAPRTPGAPTNQPGQPIPTRLEQAVVPIARRFRVEGGALLGDGIEHRAGGRQL